VLGKIETKRWQESKLSRPAENYAGHGWMLVDIK
jgi:hypothetical protein